jgi:hypothetical protein
MASCKQCARYLEGLVRGGSAMPTTFSESKYCVDSSTAAPPNKSA